MMARQKDLSGLNNGIARQTVRETAEMRRIRMRRKHNSRDSPFILGLGVPAAALTVFSCDLEPAADGNENGCH